MFDQHLYADENEDDGEADLKETEEPHNATEGKVERPQAEDRKDVRGEGDEAVLGDREDGGQGIERKTTSVVSITISTMNIGVAMRRPWWTVKK